MGTHGTQPPRLDQLRLEGLRPGDPGELVAGAELIGVDYSEVAQPELDLAGAHLDGVRLGSIRVDRANLKGCEFREVAIAHADLPVVSAARLGWTDVLVTGRLGAFDASDGHLRSVRFVGCKLGYLNLRSTELLDIAFVDCVVDTLDLGNAKARRIALEDTRIRELDVRHAQLRDVDLRRADLEIVIGLEWLRGATISPLQLGLFAPLLAAQAGLIVEDAVS